MLVSAPFDDLTDLQRRTLFGLTTDELAPATREQRRDTLLAVLVCTTDPTERSSTSSS